MHTSYESKASAVDRLAQEHLAQIDLLAPSSHYRPIIDTVGVIADIKPAALLTGEEPTLGLLARTQGLHSVSAGSPYPAGTATIIAKDLNLAEYLQTLLVESTILRHEGHSSDDQDREIGRILGYPKTATDYFIRRRLYCQAHRRYPDERWREQIPLFHQRVASFVFSPKHWPEEIEEYSAKLAEATRLYAPHTHASLLRATVGQSAAKGSLSIQ